MLEMLNGFLIFFKFNSIFIYLHLLAATTLRNALAQLSLQEILLDKDSITREIQEALDEATQTW